MCVCRSLHLVRERSLNSDERREEGAAERKKHRREETETERYSSSRDGDQHAAAAASILSENAGASGLRRGDSDAVVYSRNFRIVFGHLCVRCVGLGRFGSSLCLSFLLSLFGAETRRIKGYNGGYSLPEELPPPPARAIRGGVEVER